jgi:hypothetical protein
MAKLTKKFFAYPEWDGTVYAIRVPKKILQFGYCQLPDHTVVALSEDEYGYITARACDETSFGQSIIRAISVFAGFRNAFCKWNSWYKGSMIQMLRAAAAVNYLFHIELTGAQYNSLNRNNQQGFKNFRDQVDRVSQRAANLIVLIPPDYLNEGDLPRIDLYRTGSCH